jgi:hypothetical protein
MSAITTFRRSSAALGAAGILALSMAGAASARPDPGTGDLPRCTSGCYVGPSSESIPTIPIDGGAVEYLQLGAGILAGIVLVGAGMAVATRRSHAHAAHPA